MFVSFKGVDIKKVNSIYFMKQKKNIIKSTRSYSELDTKKKNSNIM